MQNDLYYTINQMSTYIKKMDEKIKELEQSNRKLNQVIETIQKQPPINVERIDYHFDQLKIERLEGTLNIGINPGDLEGVDEFSIGNSPIPGYMQPGEMSTITDRLQNELFTYLEEELPSIVDETKKEFGLDVDDSYTEFIRQDIQRQLVGRLEYYARLSQRSGQNLQPEQLETQIISSIKSDIKQAVKAFFSQFPRKGGDEENDLRSD